MPNSPHSEPLTHGSAWRRSSPPPARSCSSPAAGRWVLSARCGTGWCCSGHCCLACAGAWAQACRVGQKVISQLQFLFFPKTHRDFLHPSYSEWSISLFSSTAVNEQAPLPNQALEIPHCREHIRCMLSPSMQYMAVIYITLQLGPAMLLGKDIFHQQTKTCGLAPKRMVPQPLQSGNQNPRGIWKTIYPPNQRWLPNLPSLSDKHTFSIHQAPLVKPFSWP